MVNGNVGFGKDEMCSYKHTHNSAVHTSPYLAMANNPVSFVDPDGGRAELTENQKHGILRRAYLNRRNMTRIEYLRIWLGATGMNSYRGITFEGIYSILNGTAKGILFQDRYFALEGYLGELGPGFLDGGTNGNTQYIPESDKSSSGSGIFVDGLEISKFAYNSLVDNTLREDIINVASNNTTFGYAGGQYYDDSQDMFGSEKTNREVREEQNRQQNSSITIESKDLTPSFGPSTIYEQEVSTTKYTIINFNNFGNPDEINILNLDGSPLHQVTGGGYEKGTHTANFNRIFQKNDLPLNDSHNFILQIIGGPKTDQYQDTNWKYTMYNGFLEGNYRIFRLISAPRID